MVKLLNLKWTLTKSLFLAGQHCPKRLYLSLAHPEEASDLSPSEDARFSVGRTLERMARQLFPEGLMVESPERTNEGLVEQTQKLLGSSHRTLFEAAFQFDNLFVKCDVLELTDESVVLTEIKSSTRIKEEHLFDLAFQCHVLELCGLTVLKIVLCHVDNTARRGESPLTPEELFVFKDVTREVRKTLAQVVPEIEKLQVIVNQGFVPQIRTNVHCLSPYRCSFYEYCHKEQPENDLVDLPGIRKNVVITFSENGADTIDQLPPDAKLTSEQSRARDVIVSRIPFVSPDLGHALEQIKCPAHFLDFEAANPALPLFPGLCPYQAFPFQWSNHVVRSIDEEPVHSEFLHTEPGDPREAFVASLLEQVRWSASIVFYSSYEMTTVKALTRDKVPGSEELLSLFEKNGVDLYAIVKKHVYFRDFKGSFSIKKVLPAIVRTLDYGDLEIADGDAAATEYLRLVSPGTTQTEQERIARNLKLYCQRDTLAMVELYRALLALAP